MVLVFQGDDNIEGGDGNDTLHGQRGDDGTLKTANER
jgi:Ca2+-binding RTX toxin-like protein